MVGRVSFVTATIFMKVFQLGISVTTSMLEVDFLNGRKAFIHVAGSPADRVATDSVLLRARVRAWMLKC